MENSVDMLPLEFVKERGCNFTHALLFGRLLGALSWSLRLMRRLSRLAWAVRVCFLCLVACLSRRKSFGKTWMPIGDRKRPPTRSHNFLELLLSYSRNWHAHKRVVELYVLTPGVRQKLRLYQTFACFFSSCLPWFRSTSSLAQRPVSRFKQFRFCRQSSSHQVDFSRIHAWGIHNLARRTNYHAWHFQVAESFNERHEFFKLIFV